MYVRPQLFFVKGLNLIYYGEYESKDKSVYL